MLKVLGIALQVIGGLGMIGASTEILAGDWVIGNLALLACGAVFALGIWIKDK